MPEDPRPLTTADLPTLIQEVCNNLSKSTEGARKNDGRTRTTVEPVRRKYKEEASDRGHQGTTTTLPVEFTQLARPQPTKRKTT